MGSDDGPTRSAAGQSDRYSRLAAVWLRSAWREGPPRLTAVPQRLIGVVERELEGRRRDRMVRRWAGGAVAAGLVVLAVFSVSGGALRIARIAIEGQASLEPHALVIVPSETGGPVVVVAAGTRLAAPVSRPLQLASPDGTELTIEPGGTLSVIDLTPTRRFALTRGAVVAHVSKLGSGERFIIETADAEVEVHGTRFRVALTPGPASPNDRATTRVSVSEGVVAVTGPTGQVFLFAGDEWSPPAPPATRPAGPAERGALAAPRAVRPAISGGVSGPRRAPARTNDPSGTQAEKESATVLQAQDDMFMAGVSAKRSGNDAEALRQFERFIRTYPNSTLAENAVVERMRLLLGAKGAWAATAAAADYLSRYPDGFARAEARRLIDARP